MIHLLTMFTAPEGLSAQATLTSPPADVRSAPRKSPSCGHNHGASLRFMASVAASAAGFGLLLAGCWFSLQLMQIIVVM